mmetsp:Transcript_34670/g.80926  ORF Transcript_34670/g.80926 Transcript_34670/m.80926 type:complete len:306 (-) Transcript_34670:280-1197(-)
MATGDNNGATRTRARHVGHLLPRARGQRKALNDSEIMTLHPLRGCYGVLTTKDVERIAAQSSSTPKAATGQVGELFPLGCGHVQPLHSCVASHGMIPSTSYVHKARARGRSALRTGSGHVRQSFPRVACGIETLNHSEGLIGAICIAVEAAKRLYSPVGSCDAKQRPCGVHRLHRLPNPAQRVEAIVAGILFTCEVVHATQDVDKASKCHCFTPRALRGHGWQGLALLGFWVTPLQRPRMSAQAATATEVEVRSTGAGKRPQSCFQASPVCPRCACEECKCSQPSYATYSLGKARPLQDISTEPP